MSKQLQWSLTLGAAHPAGHGAIALTLTTDESEMIIEGAQPRIYPMHRGVEKLCESRNYQQLLSLADRHDWLSSFGSELGLAMLVEQMLGIAVPARATWIRTLMAELNRCIHHLRWLGESTTEVVRHSGDPDELAEATSIRERTRVAREHLVDVHEAVTGGRMHPMLVCYGGVRLDLPSTFPAMLPAALANVRPAVAAVAAWWAQQDALRGIGVLPTTLAQEFAVSGPVARASNHGLDLRFDDPYLAYGELIDSGVLRRVRSDGADVHARFEVLAQELPYAFAAIEYCANRLSQADLVGEPVNVALPRTMRVAEGTGIGWTENPTGINEWLLVSTGGPTPERLKVRTASFANAQALCEVLPGTPVADLRPTLISYFLISGDIAK